MADTVANAHVIRDPAIMGGFATITGTRVRVIDIVVLDRRGVSPAEVLDAYEHLTLGQVHAALAYYYDHRSEVDAEFEESRRRERQFCVDHPGAVR